MSGYKNEYKEVREGFYKFLQNNNDYTSGEVIHYKDAVPDNGPLYMFLNEKTGGRRIMGIMFHGTNPDNIDSIRRNELHFGSSFTSSLHYAVRRSQSKEGSDRNDVRVPAMAVLVKCKSKIDGKDERVEEPYFSIPLYIMTVSV